VLFVCAGNSARGLLAEALMTTMSKGRFKGYSAGIHPGGLVNPFAAELIQKLGYPLHELRSKRWTEYAGPNSLRLDYVISICSDDADLGLNHSSWPGDPTIGVWNIEDPTAATGSIDDKRTVFKRVYDRLQAHIELFLILPHCSFDREVLQQELNSFHELL
jgi:arsenate reductase